LFAIAQSKVDQDTLARFKKAQRHGDSNKEYAYTLAFMEATLGLTDDAQPELARAVAGEDLASLPDVAWAVHGKLCGQYGFTGCAKTSLEKARNLAQSQRGTDSPEWLLTAIGR
jgi:hypothetical protein